MIGDVQGPRKSPGENKEEYMPFSCTELSQALIDYARVHLNETEETRKRGIQEMEEFIRKKVTSEIEVPEIFYLLFLRTKKFDAKKACSLLQKGADFVDTHRTVFDRVDPEIIRRTINSKTIGFLPYRDAKGRAIVFVQSERWNPSELKADDVIFGSIVSLHVAGENPVNQVAGYVIIIDFKNLTMQQVVGMSNWLLFGLQALQRCCPCLIKEIHVVHTPAILRVSWNMVKPVLTEKIRKRITFYKSSHWNSLHRRINPSILPEELGGQLGPFSQEHWASDIADIEKRYNERINLFLSRVKAV